METPKDIEVPIPEDIAFGKKRFRFPEPTEVEIIEGEDQNRSYLKEGVNPIMTCIGSFEGHSNGRIIAFEDFIHEIDEDNNNYKVDFYFDPQEARKKNFKNAGWETYVISPIDEKNKFSREYHDCTGLVATGREKGTGKEISFLSHQNPGEFLEDKYSDFVDDFRDRLRELRERCEERTIDAIIIGGKIARHLTKKEYQSAISLLDEVVEQELGFQPAVVGGPKLNYWANGDTIFLDTAHRRLYFIRKDT